MKIAMHVAIVLLLATLAVAQAQGHQAKEDKRMDHSPEVIRHLLDLQELTLR
jgi:hypothetical protein